METTDHKPPLTRPPTSPSASTPHQASAKSSTLLWRIASLVLALILYGILKHTCTMTSADVDLSQYTHSVFIPFAYKFSTKHTPQVLCTIEGVDIEMPVDTGSTGLLVGAPILPNVSSSAGTPAHHFFTSSRILYVGRLVKLAVSFIGELGSYATSTVPVLIVDKSWQCSWYDPTKDGFECPPGPNGEKPVERNTGNITYMGVGFGRNSPKDGMPYAMPSINPFLNVNAVDGLPVSHDSMRAGYVITTKGVHLGLTSEATQGYTFTTLERGLAHEDDSRDWAMLKMCFRVNSGVENCGLGLIDTGIPHMYVRPEEGTSIPNVVIRNPSKHGYAKMVRRVKAGSRMSIGFPSLNMSIMSYSFVVGEGSTSTEPSYAVPVKQGRPPYVNTGRHFLFGYSIAFDAIGGRFGFRATNSSTSVL